MLSQNRGSQREHGAAYREFSRKRYNELRAQNSRVRESELVSKIIKEWDNMPLNERNRYASNAMIPLNVEPLATPSKDKLATNKKTTAEKKPLDKQDSSSLNLDQVNVRQFDDGSSSHAMKSKKISKERSNYLNFFNHHFKKLQQQHPRWNPRQVTSIIKLLWRKSKAVSAKSQPKVPRLRRPISGRKAFLNVQKRMGTTTTERMRKWKRLPLETRNQWRSMGAMNQVSSKTPMAVRTTIRLSSMNQSQGNLSKLLTKMM